MHSTQAVRVLLAVEDTFSATLVALVACPVSFGTLPAWWIVAEHEGVRRSYSLHRAIQREEGEVFFDGGHYDMSYERAMELLAERMASPLQHGYGLGYDHSGQRPASDQYSARV